MSNVRAEILAASRTRTGWQKQSSPINQSPNVKTKPSIDLIRMSFEEKVALCDQDNGVHPVSSSVHGKMIHKSPKILTNIDSNVCNNNVHSNNNIKSKEAPRKMSAKVSQIAFLFESLPPNSPNSINTPSNTLQQSTTTTNAPTTLATPVPGTMSSKVSANNMKNLQTPKRIASSQSTGNTIRSSGLTNSHQNANMIIRGGNSVSIGGCGSGGGDDDMKSNRINDQKSYILSSQSSSSIEDDESTHNSNIKQQISKMNTSSSSATCATSGLKSTTTLTSVKGNGDDNNKSVNHKMNKSGSLTSSTDSICEIKNGLHKSCDDMNGFSKNTSNSVHGSRKVTGYGLKNGYSSSSTTPSSMEIGGNVCKNSNAEENNLNSCKPNSAKINRTESRVSRFNNARAVFEKLQSDHKDPTMCPPSSRSLRSDSMNSSYERLSISSPTDGSRKTSISEDMPTTTTSTTPLSAGIRSLESMNNHDPTSIPSISDMSSNLITQGEGCTPIGTIVSSSHKSSSSPSCSSKFAKEDNNSVPKPSFVLPSKVKSNNRSVVPPTATCISSSTVSHTEVASNNNSSSSKISTPSGLTQESSHRTGSHEFSKLNSDSHSRHPVSQISSQANHVGLASNRSKQADHMPPLSSSSSSLTSTSCPPLSTTTTTTTTTNTNLASSLLSNKYNNKSLPAHSQPEAPRTSKEELIDRVISEIAAQNMRKDLIGDDLNNSQDKLPDLSACDISGISQMLENFDDCFKDVEMMTEEEAEKLLSRKTWSTSSCEISKPVVATSMTQASSHHQITTPITSSTSSSTIAKNSNTGNYDEMYGGEASAEADLNSLDDEEDDVRERITVLDQIEYHVYPDGHFYTEQPGLSPESEDEQCLPAVAEIVAEYKANRRTKVRFSSKPIRVYSTHAVDFYDRKNEDINPIAASAEYELEKRIEKMDVFPVELERDSEGLGLSIIGMGVGADAGLEKLGIFVKTITENGAAARDGRIKVNDQIIEADGKSLVGVGQAYAASVLRNTSGRIQFLIGRERDPNNSEIAQLIRQSLEAEKRHQELQQETHRQLLEHPRFQSDAKEEDGQDSESPNKRLPDSPEPEEEAPLDTKVHMRTGYKSSNIGQDPEPDTLPTEGHRYSQEGEGGISLVPPSPLYHQHISNSSGIDTATLRDEVEEWKVKCRSITDEMARLKAKTDAKCWQIQKQLEDTQVKLQESECSLIKAIKDLEASHRMVEEAHNEFSQLEKKYHKAKKLIRGFQQRGDVLNLKNIFIDENKSEDSSQQQNSHLYIIKALQDRILFLEGKLNELQTSTGIKVLELNDEANQNSPPLSQELGGNQPSSDDPTSISLSEEEDYLLILPHSELLDSKAAKEKVELVNKGSLANRQPPSMTRRQSSSSSIEASPESIPIRKP
ncbi:uncharacterized protein LOC141853934 [Brevipalpus obovatus]|uniref:uncharacterized protein LOC141853934 n=1 Tax=Brevipalpus obovatus TaxID=246614 RepID=UPI003D9F1FBA